MGSEKDLMETVLEIVLVFGIIIIIALVVFPGVREFAAKLGELPKAFFITVMDKLGYSGWGP
jgi:hypothetical protein